MTVPAYVASGLVSDLPLRDGPFEGIRRLHPGEPFRVGQLGYTDSAHAYALEHLLARKLGLADALTSGAFLASAWLEAIAVECVDDPLGTGVSLWTMMISYCMILECSPEVVPSATPSYSKLIWADAAIVGQALRDRAPLLLDSTLDPFQVCIHGLCIRSAAHIIELADSN